MRRSLVILLFFFVSSRLFAQSEPHFSNYYEMGSSYNPAFVGSDKKLDVHLAYNMSLTGFEHPPRTALASADVPFQAFRIQQGGGVLMTDDRIGLFKTQTLYVQYAAQFRFLHGKLRFGARLGMLSTSFDGSGTDLADKNDPAFPTASVKGSALDAGLGVLYSRSQFSLGLSATHLFSPLLNLGPANQIQYQPVYYLNAAYNIKLRHPFFTIKPSVLLTTDLTGYRADVTTRFVYTHDAKLFYGGLTYSPTQSVTFLLGGIVHGIKLGYAYELYTSSSILGNGGHELFVGYRHEIDWGRKGKNYHQSARLL